jgi:acetyltransferase-like isoleucine patch superfamily enzyme
MNTKSTHALFYNPEFGYIEKDSLTRTHLTIGSDVFIGHNAILLPTVKTIGHGAIIGAGAVVHKDIPPYAVVVGNPARIVRYRFSKPTIDDLLAERWWEKPFDEIKQEIETFQKPLEGQEQIR